MHQKIVAVASSFIAHLNNKCYCLNAKNKLIYTRSFGVAATTTPIPTPTPTQLSSATRSAYGVLGLFYFIFKDMAYI